MIQIENLVKRYGDTLALDHLNLEIQEGKFSVCWAPMVPEKRQPSTVSWPF